MTVRDHAKRITTIILLALLFTSVFSSTGTVPFGSFSTAFSNTGTPSENVHDITQIDENMLAKAALPFIENHGQIDPRVKFYANTFGGTVFVAEDGLTYVLPKGTAGTHTQASITDYSVEGWSIKESFLTTQTLHPKGHEKSDSVVNYFVGNKEYWRSDIPSYNSVQLGELWSDIDIELRATGNNVEKIFNVYPGGSVQDIRIALDGIKDLKINEQGQLVLETELGTVEMTKPIAYQIIGGLRKDVQVSYVVESNNYGFVVGNYDHSQLLVIDPLLASTFAGGSAGEYTQAIRLDSSGNVIIAGKTDSTSFPTTSGAYDTTYNSGHDVFVSKFSSDLSTLSASTFLGGSGDDKPGFDLAVDSSGNIYVAGYTNSTNFPTTTGAYDTSFNGGGDIFVSKLDNALTSLLASTYVGGTGSDQAESLVLDSSGNIFLTGIVDSSDFPTTAGAFDTTFNGGLADAFVSKLSNDLSTLSASTYLGGGGNNQFDAGYMITVDSSDNIFVTGTTDIGFNSTGSNFPTTSGAYDTTFNDGSDAFLSKFSNNLASLSASTFLGGNDADDGGFYIGFDSSGSVFLTGFTEQFGSTPDFPTTAGAYDTTFNGEGDVFVSKFNPTLSTLSASTFVGGSDYEDGEALIVDSSNNIFVTGFTASSNFPTTTGAYDTSFNGGGLLNNDAFVSKLSNDLASLSASTFLGGSGDDEAYVIAKDSSDRIFISGYTNSTNFPTTFGAYDTSLGTIDDAFISKFTADLAADTTAPTGTITINSGATYTTSTSVTLTLSCSDEGGCSQMKTSVDGTFDTETFEAFATSKSVTLPSGEGTKTVKVVYKDTAENTSSEFSDTIILDTTSPSTPTLASPTDASRTTDDTPTFDWSDSTDANTVTYELLVDNNSNFGSPEISQTSLSSSTFTPTTSLSDATYSWKVRATDAAGNVGSYSSVFTVTVNAVSPTANSQSVSTNEDTSVTITLTGSDANGDSLSFSIVTSPTKGTLGTITSASSTSATVTFTPTANLNGADSFTFKVNDGTLDSSSATVSVTINAVNDAPVSDAGADQAVDEGALVTLDGSDSSDVEEESLTYSWSQTAGSSVTLSDSTVASPTFTAPAIISDETLTFELTVSDGTSSGVDEVNVTVNDLKGTLTIRKVDQDSPSTLLSDSAYEITPNPTTLTGSLVIEDNDDNDSDPTDGIITIDAEFGTFSIEETQVPEGYSRIVEVVVASIHSTQASPTVTIENKLIGTPITEAIEIRQPDLDSSAFNTFTTNLATIGGILVDAVSDLPPALLVSTLEQVTTFPPVTTFATAVPATSSTQDIISTFDFPTYQIPEQDLLEDNLYVVPPLLVKQEGSENSFLLTPVIQSTAAGMTIVVDQSTPVASGNATVKQVEMKFSDLGTASNVAFSFGISDTVPPDAPDPPEALIGSAAFYLDVDFVGDFGSSPISFSNAAAFESSPKIKTLIKKDLQVPKFRDGCPDVNVYSLDETVSPAIWFLLNKPDREPSLDTEKDCGYSVEPDHFSKFAVGGVKATTDSVPGGSSSGRSSPVTTKGHLVQAGNNAVMVQVQTSYGEAQNIELRFESVLAAGELKVTPRKLKELADIFDSLEGTDRASTTIFGSRYITAGQAFDIDASKVTFRGMVDVTIAYEESMIEDASEWDVRFLHYDGKEWSDNTVSLDTDKNTVTGRTSSLSPVVAAIIADGTLDSEYLELNPLRKIGVMNTALFSAGGNEITAEIETGQQIAIYNTVKNFQVTNQTYAVILQIIDSQGYATSLSWQTGTLDAGQSNEVSSSWTAEQPGTYTVQIFVWDKVDNNSSALASVTIKRIVVS